MDPVTTGALIGGGAQLLGGMWANQAARSESKRNRWFQERMARHAYRYAVEDLEKAGLNPMMAALNGGAATPSGSMASFSNPAEGVTNSAISAMKFRQEMKNLKANEDLAKMQSHKAGAEERYWANKGLNEANKVYETDLEKNFFLSNAGKEAKRWSMFGKQAQDVTKNIDNLPLPSLKLPKWLGGNGAKK